MFSQQTALLEEKITNSKTSLSNELTGLKNTELHSIDLRVTKLENSVIPKPHQTFTHNLLICSIKLSVKLFVSSK